MRKRPPAWVVVAVIAAATALGSFVPSSGIFDEHQGTPDLPRAVGAVAVAADRPRPAVDAAPATTATRQVRQPAAQPRATTPTKTHPRQRRTDHEGHRAHHKGRAHHKARHHRHPRHHRAAHPVPVHARGADVSWPQCGGSLPMPRGKSFVVVGLTNGPAFRENPCVGRQVHWARAHHLHTGAYAVASFPSRRELARHGRQGPWSGRTLVGRLRNVGFHEAKRAVATMRRVGLHPPLVWVDVEPSVRRPWSRHRRLNAAVVHGLVHGYQQSGHRVGFYSTTKIWRQIVGPVRYRAPEWRTAGPASPHDALARCRQPRSSIQGGRPIIAQWWTTRRDHDALCPGSREPERLRLFFHKY